MLIKEYKIFVVVSNILQILLLYQETVVLIIIIGTQIDMD